jgi:hypothetical protein
MDRRVAQIAEVWSHATNEDILKAAGKDWDEYSGEAQRVIIEEAQKRRLTIWVKQASGRPESCMVSSALESHLALIIGVIVPSLLIGMIDLGLWCHYQRRDARVSARTDKLRQFLATERNWLEDTENILKQKRSAIEPVYEASKRRDDAGDSSDKSAFDSPIQGHDALYEEYQRRLVTYNQGVREYNAVIRKRASRWYLIPIPFKTK